MNYFANKMKMMMVLASEKLSTASGYPITIQNSAGKRLKQYKIYGNCQQIGAPTPSNPIDANGVGDLVTSGEHQGKYKIPVCIADSTEAVVLPTEYQQVEYIETSGTQYINLGLKPISNTKVEIVSHGARTTSNALFGSRLLSTTTTRFILFNRNNEGIQNIAPQFSSNNAVSYNTSYTDFVKIVLDKTGCYVNDTNLVTYSTQTISGTTYDLYLFTFNEGGTPDSRYFIGKTKYCKIWENGVLVRNMIPCYRKSDNVIGMYDTVNGVFYTNQGTGTFAKGSNITAPMVTNIYLDEQLANINDYIDYKNQKIVINGTETSVTLPQISTLTGKNVISVNTTVKPSNMEVTYYKK